MGFEKKGRKIQAVSLTSEDERTEVMLSCIEIAVARVQDWADHFLSSKCLTLNLPTQTLQRKTLLPVICRVLNYSLSAPNSPFDCIFSPMAWNSADISPLPLPAHWALPIGVSRGRRAGRRDHCFCLLSKSRHLTMAVEVVLDSSIYLTQLHPPNSLITF